MASEGLEPRQCIIIMTSNLGAGEMTNLMDGGFGFAPKATQVDSSLDDKINRTAVDCGAAQVYPGVHEPD